jgi:hypothetical protein
MTISRSTLEEHCRQAPGLQSVRLPGGHVAVCYAQTEQAEAAVTLWSMLPGQEGSQDPSMEPAGCSLTWDSLQRIEAAVEAATVRQHDAGRLEEAASW